MKKILLFFALLIQQGFAQTVTEGFDNVTALYTSGGWYSINNSNPSNGNIWFTDAGNFLAHSGAASSCISAGWYCTDTVASGDASVWLFTPPLMLHNGDTLSFYTISYNNAEYPDKMEVRLNTTTTDTFVGNTFASVGNYTDLQLTINPALDTSNYPMEWTQYAIVLTTVPGGVGMGRIGFRYYVSNTGGTGVNGSVVGIDDFRLGSVLAGVEEKVSNVSVKVYPNPVSEAVNISSNVLLKKVCLKDAQGKTCKTFAPNAATCRLDVADLMPGIYLPELETVNGILTRKLVK